jgi:Tol biopolymer transport system component
MELTAYPFTRNPSGRLTTGPPATVLAGYGSLLRQVSPDGSIMVLSNNSQGGCVVHWPATGRTLPLPHPGVLSAALAPDGKWLVTSSYLTPGLRVWSLPDGTPQQVLRRVLSKDLQVFNSMLSHPQKKQLPWEGKEEGRGSAGRECKRQPE